MLQDVNGSTQSVVQIYVSVQVTVSTADLTRLYIFLAGDAMQHLATSLQAAGECSKQLELEAAWILRRVGRPACHWAAWHVPGCLASSGGHMQG